MEILSKQGDSELATVYVAKFRNDKNLLAEFVDARDPEISKDKKWVIIVSTQFGCPVNCEMCDAGGNYYGNLSREDIFDQINFVINNDQKNRLNKVDKLKIQFARMGEPSLNPVVLDVIEDLPKYYNIKGLIPCVATTAPSNAKTWFAKLLSIRHSTYEGKQFQLQFSINSTDEKTRNKLMPIAKMSLEEISEYSKKFYESDSRKVSLNFALTKDIPVEPQVIKNYFDPKYVCIKITPLNPTYISKDTGLINALPPEKPDHANTLCKKFQDFGFDVILSIGDTRENQIGSNCGMAVRKIQS